jgi:hypothetical protein
MHHVPGRAPPRHPPSSRERKRICTSSDLLPVLNATRTPPLPTLKFVYPFTLEPHVLKLESNRRAMIATNAARREAHLRAREDEKQRRKREALRRIAPGFEPSSAPLVPVKTGAALSRQQQQGQGPEQWQEEAGGDTGQGQPRRDVMDDLVERLAALEDTH